VFRGKLCRAGQGSTGKGRGKFKDSDGEGKRIEQNRREGMMMIALLATTENGKCYLPDVQLQEPTYSPCSLIRAN
jgi:hypothetical protein